MQIPRDVGDPQNVSRGSEIGFCQLYCTPSETTKVDVTMVCHSERRDSSDHSLGGGDDVIFTQHDLSPSHGFLHLLKASTENTALQERTTLLELLVPERIEQGIILPLYHLFRDACLT